MTLCEFLKLRMFLYSKRKAFGSWTYGNLIRLMEDAKIENCLEIISCASQEEMLLRILKSIASANTVIPVHAGYGNENLQSIREQTENDKKAVPEVPLIMFTSGSSGKPKGVMLSHKNIISNLLAIEDYFPINSCDKVFVARPLSHIAVLSGEVFLALINGAEIVFHNEPLNIKRLYSKINESGATIFGGTPTLFNLLSMCSGDWGIEKAIISGEILTKERAVKFADKWKTTDFYSVYGLTENSPRVSALMPKDFIIHTGSVGKPIKNTEIKIENGELMVKSDSVMQGYYNNVSATSAKIKNGWLCTGDAAEIKNGCIYIKDRLDNMIIRSGLNIYPAEIETIICRLSGVEACIVQGKPDILSGQKIVGDVYGNIERDAVLEYIKKNLPEHLRPAEINIFADNKMTASGKTARNRYE